MKKRMKTTEGKVTVKLLVKNLESQKYEVPNNDLFANRNNAKLQFFYCLDNEEYYMFEQVFTKGVYLYFKQGVPLSEIKAYKQWNKNVRLDKTIEDRIPQCTKYIMKELV